jgi:hypothetical protein
MEIQDRLDNEETAPTTPQLKPGREEQDTPIHAVWVLDEICKYLRSSKL